jgi:hypothetical protein
MESGTLRFTQIKRSYSVAFAYAKEIETKENCSENFHRRLVMQDRRRFPRTRCFKGAKILSHNHAAVPCIVRDISAEGAGLQLSGSVALPAEFDLCLDTGRRMRQCRVMWRAANEAGIWFAQA